MKKTYIQPVMKAIHLEGSELLAGSADQKSVKVYNEQIDDSKKPEYISDQIWNVQW